MKDSAFGSTDTRAREIFTQMRRECVSETLCVVVCCGVLRCVAACCGVLRCVAMFCGVLRCVAVCCSVLQGPNCCVRCNTRPPRSITNHVCCSVYAVCEWCVAVRVQGVCSALQRAAQQSITNVSCCSVAPRMSTPTCTCIAACCSECALLRCVTPPRTTTVHDQLSITNTEPH